MTLTKACEHYYFPFNLDGANSRAMAHLLSRSHNTLLGHLAKNPIYRTTPTWVEHRTRSGNNFKVEVVVMPKRFWVLYLCQYASPYQDTVQKQLLEGCTLDEVVLPTDKVKS